MGLSSQTYHVGQRQEGAVYLDATRQQLFKKLYDQGQDPEQPDYASCRMHYSENPYLDLKELEEARRSLPEHIFAAEYEGSFTESGQTVFADTTPNQFSKWPQPQGKVFCGCLLYTSPSPRDS